jgi:uncharacterized protein YjiS (DUF1127 family)
LVRGEKADSTQEAGHKETFMATRVSTDLNSLAALEEVAPRAAGTGGDTPLVFLRRWPAGNDPTCEDQAISGDRAEQSDWRTFAPRAFGDVATNDSASSAWPSSYEMYHAARAHRSFILGGIIVAAIRAAGAIARRVLARHRQRRQARAIYDVLRQLDDRMLRDLGFDRSEITSVAAEITGEAEYARVRALPTSHGLPM